MKNKLFYLQDFTSLFVLDFFDDFFFGLLLLVVLPIVGDAISSSILLVSIGNESLRLLIVVVSAWEEFECDSCTIKASLLLFDFDFRLLFDLLRFVLGIVVIVAVAAAAVDWFIESPFVFVVIELFDGWREFIERDVWRPIC